MTTEITLVEKKQLATEAMSELKRIIASRKDPVIINKKRYLEFRDWQLIGAAFNITARVVETAEIMKEVPSKEAESMTFLDVVGFSARAEAISDGKVVSAAEAECLRDEQGRDWKNKPAVYVEKHGTDPGLR